MIDLSKQRDGHKVRGRSAPRSIVRDRRLRLILMRVSSPPSVASPPQTSRFYGPFAASLPDALTPVLDRYAQHFSFEVGGDSAYLFHPPSLGFDRPMEGSAWSGWVKRLFKRHAGVEIAPKTLRSIFITWLRDNTAEGSILKSAAHAMKHSEQQQASQNYDQNDDRLVEAAYRFNLEFAANFHTDIVAGAVASSASAAASGAAVEAGVAEVAKVAAAEEGDNGADLLVDEEWLPLPGGPYLARLMCPSRQPVSTASFRNYAVVVPVDPINTPLYPGGQIKFPIVPGAPPEGIVCQLPRSWGNDTKHFILRLKLAKDGATERVVTVASALYRKPIVQAEQDEGEEGEEEEGAESGAAAPGPASPSAVPASTLADAAAPATPVSTLLADEPPLQPAPVRRDEGTEGGTDVGDDVALAHADREQIEAGDDDPMHGNADNVDEPLLQPLAHPPPRSSTRKRKEKERYGDNGELDGRASSFRSAPPARRASVEASLEMGVPAHAMPGEQVWAMGLRAGSRMRFKAEVVSLRSTFPRIVVKYLETEDGETNPLALPELRTAYLHAGDVQARDW